MQKKHGGQYMTNLNDLSPRSDIRAVFVAQQIPKIGLMVRQPRAFFFLKAD